jgi:hypothetical protein
MSKVNREVATSWVYQAVRPTKAGLKERSRTAADVSAPSAAASLNRSVSGWE